ncbi:protein translocase sec6 [Ceraceosorus bombacis]|uniref:Protein translocase sec6 n=1 Tax=Ceraceosorus bombacis TaxID=401625 RepID=A0A0P1BTL9_9BASI|nr:protein translocase sec6 [Ceraceosorus bombacis]
MSDAIKDLVEIPQSFVKDGTQFFNKCTKPNKKEYLQICRAVGMGFVVMGFIGYFVKLIHIPLRQILVDEHGRVKTDDFFGWLSGRASWTVSSIGSFPGTGDHVSSTLSCSSEVGQERWSELGRDETGRNG